MSVSAPTKAKVVTDVCASARGWTRLILRRTALLLALEMRRSSFERVEGGCGGCTAASRGDCGV